MHVLYSTYSYQDVCRTTKHGSLHHKFFTPLQAHHAERRKSQITAHMKSMGVYQISRSLTDSCTETTDAAITISIKRVQKHLQIERSSVTPFISGEQKASVGATTL